MGDLSSLCLVFFLAQCSVLSLFREERTGGWDDAMLSRDDVIDAMLSRDDVMTIDVVR